MKILPFIILSLILTGCRYEPDNVLEELVEQAIDDVTHGVIDPDLSPATPEHGFSPKHILPFSEDPQPPKPAAPPEPVKKK